MFTVRNALGVGAVSAVTGSFAYWVDKKAKEVPEDRKGSLFLRMGEVAFSSILRMSMRDPYKAKLHTDLVASLASKRSVAKGDYCTSITKWLGYTSDYLPTDPSQPPPIFRVVDKATTADQPKQGFAVFVPVGPAKEMRDSEARRQVVRGNYIRCKSVVKIGLSEEGSEWRDVILTGTAKPGECDRFAREFLRDFTCRFAGNKYGLGASAIDLTRPYTDTPVFHYSGKQFKEIGDLATMPSALKTEMFVDHNFVACHSYSAQKTRLSSREKPVGAIIVGTKNDVACSAIMWLKHMKDFQRQEEAKEEQAKRGQ